MLNGEHLKDILLLNAFRLDNLSTGVEYEISVSAFDIYGQLSEPTRLTHIPSDVTPPSKPGNLRKVAMTPNSVTLAWDASTDDVGVCDYVIYNNHTYFDRTTRNEYIAVDLLLGTYNFEVCALDLSGNASVPAAITVDIKDESAPTGFRFTQTGLILKLEWNAPADVEVIRYGIVLTGPQGGTLPYESVDTLLQPLLLPRTRYGVSIKALTAIGWSSPLMAEFTTR
jgi:predicted phage tail protein